MAISEVLVVTADEIEQQPKDIENLHGLVPWRRIETVGVARR
jgi:hypothetical protein